VFELRNPLVEFAYRAKLELRNMVSQIWRIPNGFIRSAATDSAEEESARAFCLLNLFLLACLVFLSPDRVVQVLSPAQSTNEILSWLQDAFEMLKRLIPL
jgi:hypothetical protein